MKRLLMSVLLLVTMLASAGAVAEEIILPADTSTLRESDLPGYAIAQQKCGICHSADYVSYQPPGMSQAQWTAEMTKMQHSYGAPINEDEIKLIGAYLAVAYGSANKEDSSVVALTALLEAQEPGSEGESDIDVQALLASNTCLACHAIDKKVVGPSFQEVAARYRGDANASTEVAESIQSGGQGKWGQIAMPPMSGLSVGQARALADFVLMQEPAPVAELLPRAR
jgi:cytochrome c551/c552